MITSSQLYWITRLDCVNVVSGIVALLLGIVLVIIVPIDTLSGFSNRENKRPNKDHTIVNTLISFFLASALVFTLTPTTKEMAAILVIPKIANSEKVQAIGGKLYDLAVEWMDELKPKHEEAK